MATLRAMCAYILNGAPYQFADRQLRAGRDGGACALRASACWHPAGEGFLLELIGCDELRVLPWVWRRSWSCAAVNLEHATARRRAVRVRPGRKGGFHAQALARTCMYSPPALRRGLPSSAMMTWWARHSSRVGRRCRIGASSRVPAAYCMVGARFTARCRRNAARDSRQRGLRFDGVRGPSVTDLPQCDVGPRRSLHARFGA